MAHSGGRDTRQQQELLQRHHYHHHQRQQQQQQQQHVDLPRVPQDRIRDWDHTSTVTLATPCDPRPRSRHHRHHAGGAVTLSNQLTAPKEVKLIYHIRMVGIAVVEQPPYVWLLDIQDKKYYLISSQLYKHSHI